MNAALGDPLSAYRSVLVAGTNGKGSTAAFLEAVLRRAGVRTGLFTSPHLVSFCERIRIDGADVSRAAVADATPRVLAAHASPSFFEAAWAMAACLFAETGVEVAIWEVGLGGRLDATNVCEPDVSAVVGVALDHTHVLGDTIEAIAAEKAAVFRPGRPALTAATGAALDAVRALRPDVREVAPAVGLPTLPLLGAHQRRNASLALALAEALGVDGDPAALQDVRWPGRCERFGDVVLDCAHNADAARALLDALDRRMHLVFGATEGKDVAAMAGLLGPWARSVTLVTPTYGRRRLAAELTADFAPWSPRVGPKVSEALASREGDTLVTGSCFLVGEARASLLGLEFPERGLLTTAR